MLAKKWLVALSLAAALAPAGGCATFNRTPPTSDGSGLSADQRRWWDENRSRAKLVPGKGFYVEGTSGYFDANGRPISGGLDPSGLADDDPDKGVLDSLSVAKVSKNVKKWTGRGPDEPVARKAYETGDTLFRQASYKDAADKYTIAYERWPDSPLEEEAMFRAGESNFFADRYPKAEDAYELLIKKYPGTQYLDKISARRFAIARYWEQCHEAKPHWPVTPNVSDKTQPLFNTFGYAMRIYEKIRLDDPTGPLADDALMATANAHFVRHHYDEADYSYTLLRTEYPKSEHQYQAHLLGLRAKLLKYQGPNYEGKPLDDAEELAKTLLTQFPKELGEERERMVKVRAEIRFQKALREYSLAEYYNKGSYYGASRVHYENVVREYPDTKLAQDARAKLDHNHDQPDVPTPQFKWLVDLFPESKKAEPAMAAMPGGNPQR